MPKPLTPVAEALAYLLENVPPPPPVESLPLDLALGRVLARSLRAEIDVPLWDNSAMDGYALATSDLAGGRRLLPLSQTIAAGHPGQALAPGTVARIFTGAPLPAGADAVVMQENVRAGADGVEILAVPVPGQHIRRKGHDLAVGTEVLPKGRRLQPQDLGLLASLGAATVQVYRPLTVALVNTGDEVVAPGTALAPGQLYDSNSYQLAALLTRLGMKPLRTGIVGDTREATVAALQAAAAQADCVISTGGVSVGAEDHVRQAVETLGALQLYRLAIKPGKPFSFGQVAGRPFFGLPGNPVAVFVTFLVLVRPFLLGMQGAALANTACFGVRAGFTVSEPGSRDEYFRVRLRRDATGLAAEAFADQGSSVLSSLGWADGLALVPAGTVVEPGQLIDFLPFGGLV